MSSVSHKNPKAPWEENPLWESAESDRTEVALARQVGRGSPPTESVPCRWDVPIRLSTFHEKPGLRASPRKRPGYNYSFILPAETKSESPLLPSSTRPLGDSEKKCGCERGRVKFAWGRTRGREERGPFVGR